MSLLGVKIAPTVHFLSEGIQQIKLIKRQLHHLVLHRIVITIGMMKN
jgi:hypothetical protein